MKRLLILLAGFIASYIAALNWADSSLPLPPFPKFIWDLLDSVTRFIEPLDVHAQEGILNLLGTWLALVLAIAVVCLALAVVRHIRHVLAQPGNQPGRADARRLF